MKRSHLVLLAGLLSIQARPAVAVLTPAEEACLNTIMVRSQSYRCRKHLRINGELRRNRLAQDARCPIGYRCLGGGFHGAVCNPALGNSQCGTGECHPNRFNGPSLSRYILTQQNLFRNAVFNACNGVSLAPLGYPNAQCPYATDFNEVVDCILRSNSGHPDGGDPTASSIFDAVLEPIRTTVGNFPIDFTTVGHPTKICGVPGSWLLDWGSENDFPAVGREGYVRPLLTENCLGSSCDTKGEGVLGNMLDDPETLSAGPGIPLCVVMRTSDSGNGTSSDGTIDWVTGAQSSFYPLTFEITIGACPKCSTATSTCLGGPHVALGCVRRGAEDISCPPAGPPLVWPVPFSLTTAGTTLSVPANNPAGGATNPASTFCGSCDLDALRGCQNDQDCIDFGVCSGVVGSGCCQFGTNTGFAGFDTATSISGGGAPGPTIPHLSAMWCLGESGSALIDSAVGLPGPARYIEPRVNIVEY